MWTKADTRRPLAIALIALSVLAWLALWLWGQSPYSRFLGHHDLDLVTRNASLIVVFIAGWIVMTIAMMLPTTVPLITLFQTMIRARRDRFGLIGLLAAGYLIAWALFGIAVYTFDFGVHRAVAASTWLEAHTWTLTAATLLLAGAYQFTPLKYHCLDKCRSPLGFITARWRGRSPAREALRLGFEHGLFCIGCCWSLMLLMFAIGVGSLGWMLVLGAVMAVEKNMPWGRRISAPLGAALLAWGGLYLALSLLAFG
jgi:predicted metal-binding membrane protein